jgi:hypothetical protein
MKKSGGCCLMGTLGVIGGPLLCGMLVFVIAMTTMVGLVSTTLPQPWRKSVESWMLGTPQPVGSETSDNAAAGVGVGWDGYVDPVDTNPPLGIPLGGVPYYGCMFHDTAYSNHTGADFPANVGTPIYTTMAGKVVWAGENGPWGNLVVVENNGYQVWLAHMESIQVDKGQVIPVGELVGTVGTTGNSTGYHLHYGIKQKTDGGQVWLNPEGSFAGAEYVKVECK